MNFESDEMEFMFKNLLYNHLYIEMNVTFVFDVGFLSEMFDDNLHQYIYNPTPSALKTIHKNIRYEFWILTKIISCFFDSDSLFHVFK